jgi:predicted acyltransferase
MGESIPEIAGSGRIASIDALRGFDMFWITGGEGIIHSFCRLFQNPVTATLNQQFRHVRWEGFHFYDLIFPLFLFVVGVVLPLSLTRRLEQGANRGQLYRHAVRRLLLLFLLGLIYNGLLDFNFSHLRIAGVLQRIAICYFIAALIVMNASIRKQAIITGAILVGYWIIMVTIPVPGVGAGVLTPAGNLGGYVDRAILPGRFCCYRLGDNEGILSTIPAVATTMLGVLAGHWLRSNQSGARKVRGLALAGLGCLVVGFVWGLAFPIIKNLWTSSYVLVAGGWSLLLLAGFYWVIDVRGYKRWSYFFTVIGLNAITVYVADRLFRFRIVTDIFVHGFIDYLGPFKPLFYSVCVAATIWLFLWFLHRQKIYLKV